MQMGRSRQDMKILDFYFWVQFVPTLQKSGSQFYTQLFAIRCFKYHILKKAGKPHWIDLMTCSTKCSTKSKNGPEIISQAIFYFNCYTILYVSVTIIAQYTIFNKILKNCQSSEKHASSITNSFHFQSVSLEFFSEILKIIKFLRA